MLCRLVHMCNGALIGTPKLDAGSAPGAVVALQATVKERIDELVAECDGLMLRMRRLEPDTARAVSMADGSGRGCRQGDGEGGGKGVFVWVGGWGGC